MAAAKAIETRDIYVRGRNGADRIITIPANAKVTFGKLQPSSRDYGSGDGGNALRIYTTANNQLAVFVGVTEFRDLSLRVRERRVVSEEEARTEVGPNGEKRKLAASRTYDWVDVKHDEQSDEG